VGSFHEAISGSEVEPPRSFVHTTAGLRYLRVDELLTDRGRGQGFRILHDADCADTQPITILYITDSKNPTCADIYLFANELSINVRQPEFQYIGSDIANIPARQSCTIED
jgi:hypothetical protein